MTIRYISVGVGIKLANGEYAPDHKGSGASAVAGTAGLFFDDAAFTNMNQLRAALAHALARADQLGLAKG